MTGVWVALDACIDPDARVALLLEAQDDIDQFSARALARPAMVQAIHHAIGMAFFLLVTLSLPCRSSPFDGALLVARPLVFVSRPGNVPDGCGRR